MKRTNYLEKSFKELNELLKKKEITPTMLVEEAFARIEESDLNAFITLNKEEALKEAKELESMEVDNVLFGLPIAIKDNITTKDLRTTCASHMLEDFVPVYDATVVSKLKEKHMIIIGKTNMDEFAMGSTGETSYFGDILNPWNKKLVPGGSSSGSAASVSARLVTSALGSDTGGSIRQPSSFCGIVGLKPTYGRVSRYGLIAFGSSLDQIGPMTKNVEDNAILLNAIAGVDENDYTSKDLEDDFTSYLGRDIRDLKIAVPTYFMSDKVDEEVREKVLEVVHHLMKQGCIIDEIDIPYLEYAIPLYQIIGLGEASSNLARYDGVKYGYKTKEYDSLEDMYEKTRSEGFGEEVKRRIMIGTFMLSGENANQYYHKALKVREMLTDGFRKAFEKYDLMIGPTNTNVAYPLGQKGDDALKSFYDDILTIPVNMAGLPAMSLPIGFTKEHLPIGLHIIASYFEEGKIYTLASYLEKELNLSLNPNEKEGKVC